MINTATPTQTTGLNDSSTQNISFDFNPSHVDKMPKTGNWDTFNHSWENHTGRAADMLNIIREGYSIQPVIVGPKRSREYVKSCWHLMIDFDTDDDRSRIETVANDPIVNQFGAFVYTTPSHTPDTPRCRAVFILDGPITSADGVELAYNTLLHLFPHGDVSCKNAARLFYGSHDADYIELWNYLPLDELRKFVKAYRKLDKLKQAEKLAAAKEFKATGDSANAGLNAMLAQIEAAPDGEKYHTIIRLCYAIGGNVGTGKLDRETAWAGIDATLSSMSPRFADKEHAVKSALKSFEAGIANPG